MSGLLVDPKKTIRECLKDDGRFSAKVLTGRYTHHECEFLVVPVDILGEVLKRNADYAIYTNAPKGLRIGLPSSRRRKRTSPEM